MAAGCVARDAQPCISRPVKFFWVTLIRPGVPSALVLADGRVIFAVKAQESAEPSGPRKASIKAITWTNADGTPGRIDVTQKNNFTGLGMQG